MSTLKVNNLQVGQDSTATNNLTWFQPGSPDGTIRLGSGNAGSATTKFTFDKDGNLTCVGDITANSIIAPIEGTLDDWIVHAGDTNTKFGFPADDTFTVETGGSERLRITDAGIDVSGDIDLDNGGSAGINFKRSGTLKSDIEIGSASDQLAIRARGSSGFITFHTNTSTVERLRITSTGQFHMGGGSSWTYASQKFVVVEPNNALGMLLQGNNANEGVNLTLQNIVNANNAYSSLSFADDGGQIFGIVRGKVNDKNANTGELQFWTSGSQKLTIDKDGDVGIGEASPGSNNEKLTVREDIAAASGKAIISIFNLYQGTSGQSNQSTGALEFTFKNHNASHNWWGGRIACYNTDNYNQYTYLSFDTANAGNAAERMRLTNNGRLAIGNESPQQLLHVWPDTANTTSAYVRVTAGDRNSNTGLDLGHDASGNGHVNMVSNGTLTFSTNNAPRIKIASNSAATSIGGSMVFNAMLTTQGDVSGGLLMLKATENTNRLFVSGNDTSGCEVNLYDQAGSQKGIIGVSTTEFFIKAADSSTNIKFHTNSGSPNALVERIRFNTTGGINLYKTHCNRGLIWIHDGDGGSACQDMANVQGSGGRGLVSNKIFDIAANTTTDFAKSHWGGLCLIGWAGTGHQGTEQVMFGYGQTPSSRYKAQWVGNLTVTYTMSAYTLRISHNASNDLNFWCILIGV